MEWDHRPKHYLSGRWTILISSNRRSKRPNTLP